MARQPLVVTPELLRAAWQTRRRPDWPSSFEACMADEMLRRLVRAEAVGLAQAAARRTARRTAPPPPHAAPAAPHHPAPRRRTQRFDPKRAASGDIDETD